MNESFGNGVRNFWNLQVIIAKQLARTISHSMNKSNWERGDAREERLLCRISNVLV